MSRRERIAGERRQFRLHRVRLGERHELPDHRERENDQTGADDLENCRKIAGGHVTSKHVADKLLGPDRLFRIGDAGNQGEHFGRAGRRIDDILQAVTIARQTARNRDQRAVAFFQRRSDLILARAAMIADQAVAQARDLPALFVIGRDDGEIAFGVGAHRAVVEIGGTDAQKGVVHDHDFGMHHGRGRAARLPLPADAPARPAPAGLFDNGGKTRAPGPHALRLQPGVMGLRRDDQDFQFGIVASGAWPAAARHPAR